ncbi:cobyric acid synthase [Thermus thermamylovorans]|uniref:Cobyric acid synthase n=1 Tax=Thermus thermamylovorans TaxID=2509362 RepID=A0A4Q9B052_9DEIN|nr:cobyric acid synthase [Thermus thermamylovorans]TBH17607.1 cobyric acid synthase [Thermus thermamylovorans]
MRARALAVWGTGSGVGKSFLTAGLLRHFRRLGLRAAPFKAQNMSNHARVVAGGEMASAQWLQALAAGVPPDPRMNPVLVKPFGERGSQVVVLGQVDPRLSRLPWRERRPHLLAPVREALEGLLREYDLLVLEGAGSPVERNLWPDLPNLQAAAWADARALLVADVDQGGSLGALFGTWALLGEHRERLVGFVLNKFRGDLSLLEPAYGLLRGWTGVPVLGTLPLLPLDLPEEDGFRYRPRTGEGPKVAVLRYPHAANLDEFWPLSELARPLYARTPEEAEGADLLILPGSRLPARDLPWLRGFLPLIREHTQRGKPLLAVCGGAEMLSELLVDEEGVEERGVFPGLGLLPFRVRMAREKTVRRRRVRLEGLEGFWGRLNGLEAEGYEIHHGQGLPLLHQEGPLLATWLHGLLEDPAVQRALFGREARGLEAALEGLADAVEAHLDLGHLHRALGLVRGGGVALEGGPSSPDPPPPPGLVLLLGGAKSGKSRFAQRLAGPFATLIATAEARDEEMAERIARHRAERPPTWETLEEPRDLAGALRRARHPTVVVDCLTLWVANLLEGGLDPLAEAGRFLEAVRKSGKRVIAVSNEVGMGIVPAHPLARRYRDLLGQVNALLAEGAEEAYLLVAGRPLPLPPRRSG